MERYSSEVSEKVDQDFLENIDYFTLIKDLLKNWWIILLAGAAAYLAVSCLPYLGYHPMYTASSTMVVTGTARSNDSFSVYASKAQTFADVLTDEYLLQEVAEEMGLRKLGAEVQANVISETNLVEIQVRSEKPTTSYRVLNGILEHYLDISQMLLPGYILETLVPPSYPSAPDNGYVVDQLRTRSSLIAMAVTAAIILAYSYFYDSVRREKDVEQKLDTHLLAAIYHEQKNKTLRRKLSLRKRKTSLLMDAPVASFGFVETYRRLREKIRTRCTRSGKKIILVTSMLENEGKSTVAANLALALSGVSQKVLLLDADLRKPAQYKIFQCKEQVKGSLSGFLQGKDALEDCLFWNEEHGIYMMCDKNYHKDSSEIISTERMKQLLALLGERMEYIILDTPPMELVADAEALAQYADYSLLVLSPDRAPTKAVNDCIDRLNDCHAKLLGCILNNIYTLSLLFQQVFGMNLAGVLMPGAGKSDGYAYRYGYGYGSKEGYGYGASSKDSESVTSKSGKSKSEKSKKNRKNASGLYRELVSGEDFFAGACENKNGLSEPVALQADGDSDSYTGEEV